MAGQLPSVAPFHRCCVLVAEGIKPDAPAGLHWRGGQEASAWSLLGLSRVPLPLADFNLYPFIVRNHDHDDISFSESCYESSDLK